ncbi:hypothetical protein [Streptomyces sp. NBC_01565]|uniref:hypothetical protein n=1 Tax=Streptomyces sp. NBC_01565 TaxID=2975881 RepID=UPI00224D2897|nr:hypothetical protein [Streptomyces sp. NBC_01565]MCX4546437.1 hypothetical protein [Streptomyces sp. NBC_01565]
MGQPKRVLRGRTDEANALAVWLGEVTRGKTVRELQDEMTAAGFPYAKSSWGEVLKGSRPPPRELIEAVVRHCVTTDQDARLEEGLELFEAAKRAQQALGDGALPPAAGEGARLSPLAQAYKDLAEAQQKNVETWQKLHESEVQRQALEKAVSLLGARCTELEVRLERAEEGRAELELELEQLRGFWDRAGGQLEHARRLEEKAFTVHTAAVHRVIRDEAVLRDMGRDVTPGDGLAVFAEDQAPPRLEEIAQFLEAVEAQLDAQDTELDELGEEVGLEPPPDAGTAAGRPPVVPGHVADADDLSADLGVPGQRQDSQDTARTSENTDPEQQDNQPLLHLLESARTSTDIAAAFKHLEEREDSLTRLTAAELTARTFGDAPDAAQHWAVQVLRLGRGMPMAWEHLHALLTVLDATPEEVHAFERTYERVGKAYLSLVSTVPAESPRRTPSPPPPTAAALEMPPAPGAGAFERLMATVLIAMLGTLPLLVIGSFQRAPGRWLFMGAGVFLLVAAPVVWRVREAWNHRAVPDATDDERDDQPYDQTYNYPPMV